ncbi:hypothetical protein GALMADRAFT_54464 [Galerina marginata CBS 339.88]|uniref:Uncharacterized protein n=1 Tax=Galerina marginata (strain CBS 339.88) TaxID=685588 RepID=A0A067TVF3_GALM3|nr:hypothetical protein GALMADRAFT_54464 [Galerina marginata CBS 339.88]
MRLQITRLPDMKENVAFIYDPIFVETQYKSYILDWGGRQTNQNIEKYISRHKGMDLVFHMFTFPVKEKSWFYLGAHLWSVVQVNDFWPLDGGRQKILRKLCQRSRGGVDETEMAKLLDNGELKQLCIELTAVRNPKVSHQFITDVLGRHSTPPSDLRRDRRVEGVKE